MRAFYGSRISGHMIETPEGYLICKEVPIARTGNQDYRGSEFGGEDPEKIYKVKRLEEEVFSKAALASFEGKPVVDEHPNEDVTAENIKRYIKGTCRDIHQGTGILSDCIVADLIIYDKDLIQKIKDGKRDISCGYDCLWDPVDEDTYIQREIRGNHVAVVDKGRAGKKVSIRDSQEGGKRMKNRSLWGRMLSAFAKDGDTTPEDLEQAAKLNPKAEDEDEVQVPKKEEEKKDKESALEERLKRIEDALEEIPGKFPAQEKAEDEESDEEDTPNEEKEGDALDSLENELESDEEAQDEEAVTVDPEEINRANEEENKAEDDDEDLIPSDENEDVKAAKDAALDAIRALRPVVAALPTRRQRKKAADSIAALIRGNLPDNGYGVLMQARNNGHANAKDRAMDDRELGKMIRDKYNPHYRKN